MYVLNVYYGYGRLESEKYSSFDTALKRYESIRTQIMNGRSKAHMVELEDAHRTSLRIYMA